MFSLYHYCAVWVKDGNLHHAGGVVKSPEPVCFANYDAFVDAVRKQVGEQVITLTSLTYLAQESE